VIVLLLVLVWLVVLTPIITHRLSSTNMFSSMVRFRADTRLLRRILGHREDSLPVTSSMSVAARMAHGQNAHAQSFRHAEHAKQRQVRQRIVTRRRRIVSVISISLLGSLFLGALPALHAFWIVSGLLGVSLVSYLALLVRITRIEVNTAERNRKVIRLPQTVFPVFMGDATGSARSATVRQQIRYVAIEAR
jgi:hypothetical protein